MSPSITFPCLTLLLFIDSSENLEADLVLSFDGHCLTWEPLFPLTDQLHCEHPNEGARKLARYYKSVMDAPIATLEVPSFYDTKAEQSASGRLRPSIFNDRYPGKVWAKVEKLGFDFRVAADGVLIVKKLDLVAPVIFPERNQKVYSRKVSIGTNITKFVYKDFEFARENF